jgi:hypothetical protein
MGNLTAFSSRSADPRPFQFGRVEGVTKSGVRLSKGKQWLADTGAAVSAITKSNADDFDLTTTAGTAFATSGGVGLLMKTGLTMFFEVEDSAGVAMEVKCALDVGVKPDDLGSEILGMDQIAHVNARIEWDPAARDGNILVK